MKARSLMVLGTGSGVGKSLITAGLLRIFSDMGLKAAPFKAQNMALNSFVTLDGGEIGRAQALQAEAARVEPTRLMNPVLLKATGEAGCQVIVNGAPVGNMSARQYYSYKDHAWKAATSAYDGLSRQYEVIVMEGAGSPAEINLMDKDIVNIKMAAYAEAPAILVGDIERGGVFAALYGTLELLGEDSGWIKGTVINKFRGDKDILAPGLEMIEKKTGVRCLGVLPWMREILSEEDSLGLEASAKRHYGRRPLRITVLRNAFISNFTDFEPFLHEPDVELVYSLRPADIEGADMVLIPGSKSTCKDILYLRETGAEAAVKRAAGWGVPVVGLCGGYQMMGRVVKDPSGVESDIREAEGMGLLDVETVLEKKKTVTRVEGASLENDYGPISGYEIHAGRTEGDIKLFSLKRLAYEDTVLDGSRKANAWGTYIHGIFENNDFRTKLLNELRQAAGLPLREAINYQELKDGAIDRLAALLRDNLDMEYIKGLLCIK